MYKDSFEIKKIYSGALTDKEIDDFKNLCISTYGEFNATSFRKKYIDNIYGESLLLFAYDSDKCAAIQCFIRSDLHNTRAMQSGDSMTRAEYQGKGLFTQLVKEGVKELETDYFIYGFPNENSFPIFKKMGWKSCSRKKYLFSCKKSRKRLPVINDTDFNWIIEQNVNVEYVKRESNYYLAKKRNRYIDVVFAKLTEDQTTFLKQGKGKILLQYDDKGKLGYGCVPIFWNSCETKIELYKMDTML
ncbi:MAG TPA: hypothetical protein DHV96_05930 [Lachnospiraceae bacterium]|nr:hypothetical protein [Lachnospiraceae bacterium]